MNEYRAAVPLLALLAAACNAQAPEVRRAPESQPTARASTAPGTSAPAAAPRVAVASMPAAPSAVSAEAQRPASVQPIASAATASGGAAPAPPASATLEAQDRAVALLRRVERAASGIRSLQADFVQTLEVPLLGQRQESRGRMYQRRPDRFAMRFTQPAGDVMVADGRYFWIYYPSSDGKQVIRTSIRSGAEQVDLQRQFLGNATARFVPTLNGEATVDGRATWVMTLVPKTRGGYKILKVWVDKENALVRRFEMTEENDSVRRVELRNLRVNVPLSDALFAFTPPAGAQIFDQ